MPSPRQARTRELQREIGSIVRRHLEEGCERAWTEIAQRFDRRALFAKNDPTTAAARDATHALVTLLVNGLGRLAVAALLLPAREVRQGRRRFTAPPPVLAAIPGGRQDTLPNMARRTL